MKSELFPDQVEAYENIRASLGAGVKRLAVQAPTGYGKTKLAAKIMDGVISKGNRAAFVVPAIDLIDQTIQSFWAEGITEIGVVQADHGMTDWSKPIQICSADTLASRGAFPEAKVVLFDEVHRRKQVITQWLKHPDWQRVPMIGLSATPWSKGLGQLFESLLVAATTADMIKLGRLSPFVVYAAGKPDLSDVKMTTNADGERDYQQEQLSKKMQAPKLVADIVDTWRNRWGQGKSLIFGVDRAHAKLIQERFQHAGVKCGYQDADTSMADRHRLRRAFHSGEVDVVSNVATLTTGVDWDVRYIGLARPTKSEMLYVQIFGRGLRLGEGKDKLIFCDHTQTTQELGFVTDIHHETLHVGKPPQPGVRKSKQPKECPKCTMLKSPLSLVCEGCGYTWDVRSTIIEEAGELDHVDSAEALRRKKARKAEPSMFERQQFYCDLRGYALEKGYKPGWAAQKYKTKFKTWPPREFDSVAPAREVSPKTRSWIRSQQIAWAKSKHNGARHVG